MAVGASFRLARREFGARNGDAAFGEAAQMSSFSATHGACRYRQHGLTQGDFPLLIRAGMAIEVQMNGREPSPAEGPGFTRCPRSFSSHPHPCVERRSALNVKNYPAAPPGNGVGGNCAQQPAAGARRIGSALDVR